MKRFALRVKRRRGIKGSGDLGRLMLGYRAGRAKRRFSSLSIFTILARNTKQDKIVLRNFTRPRMVIKPRGLRYRYRYGKVRRRIPRPLRKFFLFARNNRLSKFGRAYLFLQRAYKFYFGFGRVFRLKRVKSGARTVYTFRLRLESRLIVALIRTGAVRTAKSALHYLKSRGVVVNRRVVTSPSYTLRYGDVLELRPSTRRLRFFFRNQSILHAAVCRVVLSAERFGKLVVTSLRLWVAWGRAAFRRRAWERGLHVVAQLLVVCAIFQSLGRVVIGHRHVAQPHCLATELVFKRYLKGYALPSATQSSGGGGSRQRKRGLHRLSGKKRSYGYPKLSKAKKTKARKKNKLARLWLRVPKPLAGIRQLGAFKSSSQRRQRDLVYKALYTNLAVTHRDRRLGAYIFIWRSPLSFWARGVRPPLWGNRAMDLLRRRA